jgi:mannose-6-phosphate isomerase-like protein (cupin superfamily)
MNAAAPETRQDLELWFMNTWTAIRRSSADGPDGTSIIEHHMPYGESAPMHVHHGEDEIFRILEGEMLFKIGNLEVMAGPGQTVVAPQGVPHAFRPVSPDGVRCLTLLTGPGFEGLLRAMGRPALRQELPPASPPSAEFIALLAETAARHGIDIVGPPLD